MTGYLASLAGQVWPNLIASGICAGIVWWRLHRAIVVRHVRQAAQAALHHAARADQAERHHAEVKRLLASHCADLKSHVSSVTSHAVTGSVLVPQELLDVIKQAPGKGT